MADYINKNILSQSYVHVEPEWLTSFSEKDKAEKIALIKSIITVHAQERMKFFLYDDIVVDVEFEEGSIKAKITAYGKVCVLLSALNPLGSAITQYPEYRDGIKTIFSDVTKLSDMVNSEVLFQTNSRHKKEIIRIEARKGVIGSLYNINKKINDISSRTKNSKDNSPAFIYTMFLGLHKDILGLMDNVNDKDDKELVRTSLIDGVKKINLKVGVFDLTTPIEKKMHKELLAERNKLITHLKKYK